VVVGGERAIRVQRGTQHCKALTRLSGPELNQAFLSPGFRYGTRERAITISPTVVQTIRDTNTMF
jgi:hypothetical protein